MELKEIKIGEIFTIGETPSYPKLRTPDGYIDMRDKIVKKTESLKWPLRIMPREEVQEKFKINSEELSNWLNSLINHIT